MKRILILLLYIIGTFHIANAQQIANLTKENAWQIVQEKIVGNKKDSVNVYVSNSIVKANSAIITMNGKEISPIFDSWFFFIDDMPYDNWSHPCRYVFVNIYNGELVLNHRSSPPLTDNMQSLVSYNMNSSPQILFNIKKKQLPSKSQSVFPYEHEYAVIISGGGNANINYERYWNDCSAIYQTLINIYGFSKNNIYVLMSDGTDPGLDRHMNNGTYQSSPLDLDGDGVSDIQYAATLSNISNVFNYLSSILTSDDNLFVFTTDHGGQIDEQHVVMTLWNNSELHDYTFASYINNMNANTIKICMGQCNSGGFIDNITRNNVIISTACRYDEPSHSASNYLYDEFIYHWISAVSGETPTGTFVNADSNNDGIVSMSEAFDYANTHDTKNETPQYSSNPVQFGNFLSLNNYTNQFYSISGPNLICPNSSETYSINNLPPTITVSWSYFPFTAVNLQTSGNSCTVSGRTIHSQSGTLTATLSMGGHVINTLTKNVICHGNFSATYSQAASMGYDAVVNEPIDNNRTIMVATGTPVYINSANFYGMNVSCNYSSSVTNWSYNGNSTVSLTYPTTGIGPLGITISAEGTPNCNDFDITVLPLPPGGQQLLLASLDGRQLFISIVSSGDTDVEQGSQVSDSQEWTLEIYESSTGLLVYNEKCRGNSHMVDTTGWKSGVYVVRASFGKDVLYKKITIT